MANDPLLQTMQAAIEPVKSEFLTFLQNNHALTDQDRKTGDVLSSETMTPAQIEASLKQFAATAAFRLKETDNQFARAFDGHHFPGIMTDDAVKTVQKINDPKLNEIVKDLDTGGFAGGGAKGYGTPGRRVADVIGYKPQAKPLTPPKAEDVVKTGMLNNKKVYQLRNGSTVFADGSSAQ